MSICECGQVSVPLGKVSVLVFGTIHGVTACGPSDRHWKYRAEKAEATIQRVRELHTPYRIMLGHVPTDTNCDGCRRVYPCPTIRALDGER